MHLDPSRYACVEDKAKKLSENHHITWRSNQLACEGGGMLHIGARKEIRAVFCWRNLKKKIARRAYT
jgi:hypothetical protein